MSTCHGPISAPRRTDRPARLFDARRRLLGANLSLAYRTPLEIVRGAGTHLFDQTGRAFLDMVNNVAHVGHAHPRVVAAGARQMTVLNTNTRYLHPSIVRYAERLAAMLPEPLSVCFFVCSGSEANELALRMARAHTGKRGVIVLAGAYHGNTQGLIDVSPYKFEGPGGSGRPEHGRTRTHVVPMPDDYRGLYRRDDPRRAEKFAAHVARGRARRATSRPSSARACSPAAARSSCRRAISRPPTGTPARPAPSASPTKSRSASGASASHFWGFQTQGVVPDIVTLGKPIGNGHPLGAVVTTPAIAASFANGMEYFNTFGGNPVSCEIGLAVLDVIRDEGLQERALASAAGCGPGSRASSSVTSPRATRGASGSSSASSSCESKASRTPSAARAAYVVERMKDHGILLSTDGPDHNVIKMKPPLSFSDDDAARVLEALDRVLSEDFVRTA